jgi:hypothetical protein
LAAFMHAYLSELSNHLKSVAASGSLLVGVKEPHTSVITQQAALDSFK